MCILKEVRRFIKNGASTREASQGNYKQNSEAISEIRKKSSEKAEVKPMTGETF